MREIAGVVELGRYYSKLQWFLCTIIGCKHKSVAELLPSLDGQLITHRANSNTHNPLMLQYHLTPGVTSLKNTPISENH